MILKYPDKKKITAIFFKPKLTSMPEIKSAQVTSEHLQNERFVIFAHRPYQVIKHLHSVAKQRCICFVEHKIEYKQNNSKENWCDMKFQDMSCHGVCSFRPLKPDCLT